MRHSWMIVAIGLSATVGCFVAPRSIDEDDETSDPTRSFEGGTVGSNDDASKGADSSGVNDPSGRCIPQDLKDLLDAECSSCHGAVPKKGAETILSFTDLTFPSSTGKSVAEESLARMKNAKDPMPPDGVLASNQLAPLEAWIAGGQKSSCTASSGDAGAAEASVDATKPPPKSVCTSKSFWTKGNDGSSKMLPGSSCNSSKCHSFGVAGTVYPTLTEPDNCNGVNNSAVKVVITDANNKVTTISVNAAGNFYTKTKFAAPFKAKVMVGTNELVMKDTITDGSCNSCHTEFGLKKAPGRVSTP